MRKIYPYTCVYSYKSPKITKVILTHAYRNCNIILPLTLGSSHEPQLRDSDLGTQHDAYHKFSVHLNTVQLKAQKSLVQ